MHSRARPELKERTPISDRIFPILGSQDPPMVGRTLLLQRVWSDLTKATPSNLSIVGPRYVGKTVFLKELAARAKQGDSPYALILYWELGPAPPRSDEAFIEALCDRLRDAMGAASTGDYSEHRGYLDKTYGSLKEVTDLLDSEGKSVLMIWDGLDKALGQGSLTGHLLGQMRDIFHGKRHKIVTAARKTPSELARNKQVYDSEFWNLFDPNPVRVESFTVPDIEAALAKGGVTLSPGGRQELDNWTGGYPPFLLAVLNKLIANGQSPFSNDEVNTAAHGALDDIGEMLTTLWEKDFSVGVKDVYRLLAERQELFATDIGTEETKYLVSWGFAVRAGNKVKPACRLLQAHVQGTMPDAGSMARLFGTWTAYRSGIRDVLELRLNQISTVNTLLRRLVERSIEDIPDFPDACLNCLSQIEDLALDLIWESECGSSKQIPNDVVAYWTVSPRDRDKVIAERMNNNDWSVPTERFKQVALLQMLTGSRIGFDHKAKKVSKDTYVLINAIHSFRNRSEHPEGQAINEGVAVAAMMTCLELLACLARELL
jgi:hypothetical protein